MTEREGGKDTVQDKNQERKTEERGGKERGVYGAILVRLSILTLSCRRSGFTFRETARLLRPSSAGQRGRIFTLHVEHGQLHPTDDFVFLFALKDSFQARLCNKFNSFKCGLAF